MGGRDLISGLSPTRRTIGAILIVSSLTVTAVAHADPLVAWASHTPAPDTSIGFETAVERESLALTMSSRVRSLPSAAIHSVQAAAGHALQTAKGITDSALELIGVRYRFGGQSPERGMDCSGFVRYVFEQVTGVMLPRSAREQAKVGESVDIDELKPGDLVFFNTRRHAFSHVGIYLGDNTFIHAPSRKGSVRVTSIDGHYWKARFDGARRLLGVMPGLVSIEAAKAVLQSLPTGVARNDEPVND